MPERELVALTLQGTLPAFRVIVERTEKLVIHIISGLVPGREDQEDLTQETFLKAFQHLRHFQFDAKLSTWIARIAYNTCVSHLRKKKIPLSYGNEVADMSTPDNGTDPFSQLTEKVVVEILQEAIDRLQPLHKTLITLFHQEALSITEISHITGLPEGTVKSYLYRARRDLRDFLLITYKNREAL
ncbi:RNA polymerase sigma-70 factor, ECF subfamily [Chitinophaga jiangningensis]|uniref:RNA polymerase sigma-70 factor, ECF subfamily n=1 Tax=Chitinophaga jiangningensis TaxID=1419482 RepID=A0A1M7A5X2_9BACT|nr:sigma-70 family RNA polymerase sigma factor [Chitinophaga jiangningensis]SHL38026.1 RNA polymerase sigma-70 factor, ECF subfamily [Chitinophaga jiangningensis]